MTTKLPMKQLNPTLTITLHKAKYSLEDAAISANIDEFSNNTNDVSKITTTQNIHMKKLKMLRNKEVEITIFCFRIYQGLHHSDDEKK